MPLNNKQSQAVFFKITSSFFSNLPTIVQREMKLCAHVYFIVSMTTVNKNSLRHFSLQLHLSFSKLHAIQCMELKLGSYACVFQCFCDDNEQKMASVTFSYNYFFSLLKLANHAMHGSETWHAWVFQGFHDNRE